MTGRKRTSYPRGNNATETSLFPSGKVGNIDTKPEQRNIIAQPKGKPMPAKTPKTDQPVENDGDLVKATLRGIMIDPDAPAAAKAQAARTLAEMHGLVGRHSKPSNLGDKPLSEMTRAELEQELAAAEASD